MTNEELGDHLLREGYRILPHDDPAFPGWRIDCPHCGVSDQAIAYVTPDGQHDVQCDNLLCPHMRGKSHRRHRRQPYVLPALFEPPPPRPFVVDGIIRRGDAGVVVGGAKSRKTFFAACLYLLIAAGGLVLGRFRAHQGRVLLIDNELQRADWHTRAVAICKTLGLDWDTVRKNIDCHFSRENEFNIDQIYSHVASYPKGHYSLIVIDSLYQSFPDDADEQSTAQMRKAYRTLTKMATQCDTGVLAICHTTKGSQNARQSIDAISGSGVAGRSVDFQMFLRHFTEDDGSRREEIKLEFDFRALPPHPPIPLRFEFPCWKIIEGKSCAEIAADHEAEQASRILSLFTDPIKKSALRTLATKTYGYSERGAKKLIERLIVDGDLVADGHSVSKSTRTVDPTVGKIIAELKGEWSGFAHTCPFNVGPKPVGEFLKLLSDSGEYLTTNGVSVAVGDSNNRGIPLVLNKAA